MNIIGKGLKLGVFVFAAILVTACQSLSTIDSDVSKENASQDAKETTPVSVSKSDHFVVYDTSLNSKLFVNRTVMRPAGDLSQGMVEIQNRDFTSLKMEYRFAWYDVDDVEIEPDSRAWQPLVMPANGIKTLKTTAPRPTAKHFKVFVRED